MHKLICTDERWLYLKHERSELGQVWSTRFFTSRPVNEFIKAVTKYIFTDHTRTCCVKRHSVEVQLKAFWVKYQERQGNSFCALVQREGFVRSLRGSSSFDCCVYFMKTQGICKKLFYVSLTFQLSIYKICWCLEEVTLSDSLFYPTDPPPLCSQLKLDHPSLLFCIWRLTTPVLSCFLFFLKYS